jgi:peptidylprolyl isomerase
MRLTLCAVAAAAALAVAGCGDDSGSSGNDSAANTQAQTTTTPGLYENTLPKPRSPGPHPGARVERLIVRDLREGTGPALQAGDNGIFDFIGVNWVTGERLDDSWGRRRPFETEIERNVVIDGWWQGIPGMRVGGRRTLIVPPSLGFTQSLVPGLSGATTYFDVVLLGIRPQQPRGLTDPAPAEDTPTG